MPLHNVTIDDASALIGYYSPNGIPWKDSSTNDTRLGGYWNHTYHSSNQPGAWSSFRFQGTAVYLFVATRIMHGKYNIFMDNQRVYQGTGYTKTPVFRQLAYNATSLSPGWHNLTLVNAEPGRFIEVDYIIWTTVMPAALNESSGTPIPHTLGNMTYDVSIWDANGPVANSYMETKTNGATVNVTFKGNGIELYGRTGPDYGMFSAQVDDLDSHELDSYSAKVHDTLLFRQDNLTDGGHTLIVTNRENSSLAIASAVPIIWSDGQDPQDGSININRGLIAGMIIALTLGMALLTLLWLWFARRHHSYQSVYTDDRPIIKIPKVYQPTYATTPFIFPPAPLRDQTTPHSPREYNNGGAQGAAYPVRHHASPTSPRSGGPGSFEHHSSATNLVPSGYINQPGSFRPHAYNVSAAVVGSSKNPENNHRPVVPASGQAQSRELFTSSRDSRVDSIATTLPPYRVSAVTISGRRD